PEDTRRGRRGGTAAETGPGIVAGGGEHRRRPPSGSPGLVDGRTPAIECHERHVTTTCDGGRAELLVRPAARRLLPLRRDHVQSAAGEDDTRPCAAAERARERDRRTEDARAAEFIERRGEKVDRRDRPRDPPARRRDDRRATTRADREQPL